TRRLSPRFCCGKSLGFKVRFPLREGRVHLFLFKTRQIDRIHTFAVGVNTLLGLAGVIARNSALARTIGIQALKDSAICEVSVAPEFSRAFRLRDVVCGE